LCRSSPPLASKTEWAFCVRLDDEAQKGLFISGDGRGHKIIKPIKEYGGKEKDSFHTSTFLK
jgi:hypothetical protein